MTFDYASFDGVGLAELVRKKEVQPRELVAEAIARIERLNPELNAVIHTLFDQARAQADKPPGDGPFAGVPLLVKDLVSSVAGAPMASGTAMYKGWIAPRDSELITRFRRAGFILVGKTNTPEFGLTPFTEPAAFGPARNPWNRDRTTGGSSGGSAAAVAARLVPIASGGDGGGSIRIPASCCGVFGLKPTRARTPAGPEHGDLWQGCAVEHVLTRSVRDSAAVLDAIHGPDAGAPYHAPAPARPFAAEVGTPPGRLKIAFTAEPLLTAEVHPDCRAAVADAVKLLGELGHEVVEARPPLDGDAFAHAFMLLIMSETSRDMLEAEATLGRKAGRHDFEPFTWVLSLLARHVSSTELAGALRHLRTLGRSLAPFFAEHDLLLTPTLARPPILHGELMPKGLELTMAKTMAGLKAGRLLKATGTLEKVVKSAFGFTPFTPVWNATGQPAMSVPLFWNGDGLPVGVQLVGRFGDEATLLRLAAQLEEARPWRDRKPTLV